MGEFVIPCRDPAEVFDLCEHALDGITITMVIGRRTASLLQFVFLMCLVSAGQILRGTDALGGLFWLCRRVFARQQISAVVVEISVERLDAAVGHEQETVGGGL